jgi:hypothetical protein
MIEFGKEQDFGMLARVLASYAAWLLMTLTDIPAVISIFIVIAAPMFFGSVIWHLWKKRSGSLVNRIAFCGAAAFFPFLVMQMFIMGIIHCNPGSLNHE